MQTNRDVSEYANCVGKFSPNSENVIPFTENAFPSFGVIIFLRWNDSSPTGKCQSQAFRV